jgi:ankyrin repeat protein
VKGKSGPALQIAVPEERTFMRASLHFTIAVCLFARPVLCQPQREISPVSPKAQSLFEALRQGEASTLRNAIEEGTDANVRDAEGNTLLMYAAVYAKPTDLEFLLAHGADVNAANKAGHTALMRAMPDPAKVKLLVKHGADVNASAGGTTPLLIAAGIRSADDVLRYLIENSADLKATDGLGLDPVMTAAAVGAIGNLKILVDAGGSGSSEAKNRPVPATTRISKLDQATLDRLRKRAEGVTALMSAARVDCEACVRLLLDHGADAKAKTDAGLTALHYAAFKGNLTTVKSFLEAGAAVNAADDRGLTPLMMAANSKSKDPEVARLLLDHGADRQAKDDFGRTPAEWARIGGRPEIVKLLPGPVPVEAIKTLGAEPAFKDVHTAVAKSVELLEQAAPKFFAKAGCISCHNVSIPLIALNQARSRGYPVKSESTQQLVKQTLAAFSPQRDNLLSSVCGLVGKPATGPYALMSLHGEGYPPGPLTDGIVRCLALDQYPDGHSYHGVDTRPPLSAESSIPDTALAARAINLYPVPALASDLKSKVARAQAYLLSAKPWFGDDYAYRLFGLLWTEARQEEIKGAARELVAQQRPDGGWAQTPYMSSDAYETGLSLSALASADPASVDDVTYRRGVDYLMRTQETDGSWHVHTRAFGFQPYFESGFPHGHDQWISMAATAWSAMALMPAAERKQGLAAR